jgi:hypothetical protein
MSANVWVSSLKEIIYLCTYGLYGDIVGEAGTTQSVERLAMDLTVGVQFPAGITGFSLPHSVQIGSQAHPASYQMGTWSSFPQDKAAVA